MTMEKKSVALQITILIAFGTLIFTFINQKIVTPFIILNVFIETSKPYVFWIGVCCFIAPLVNFIFQLIAPLNKKRYDERPFYKISRAYLHLSLLIMGMFIMAWIWVLLLVGITILSNAKTALAVSSILIIVCVFVIDALTQKYLGIRYYDIFHWIRD